MNGGRCGRCKGRGQIRELRGLGMVDCPACTEGVHRVKASLGRGKVSLGIPTGRCPFDGKPATVVHHVCPQQRIDAYVSDDELATTCKGDRRNGLALCTPCHELLEGGHPDKRIAEGMLHPGFWSFVIDWDLWAAIPGYLQTNENWARLEAAA